MKLKIIQDDDALSPNEWHNEDLFLVSNHRSFSVYKRPIDVEIAARVETHYIFKLEAYIHSGVVLALAGEGPFPDRQWDVSQCGLVFVSKTEWLTVSAAREAAQSLIVEWNQYLSGDVWGYCIEDDNGNQVDSCWGFYGREYAEQEGKRMLEHAEKYGFDPVI